MRELCQCVKIKTREFATEQTIRSARLPPANLDSQNSASPGFRYIELTACVAVSQRNGAVTPPKPGIPYPTNLAT